MGKAPLFQKLDQLPRNPGVYLFKDARAEILYVGKAASLYQRVRSYFQKQKEQDGKTLNLLGKVADLDFIVTETEKEAFILEDNLIKEYHPRYNIKLRDDKHYPYLRLSPGEEPTLSVVRRVQKDSSLYFGPYPSAKALRETIKVIRKIVPLSTSLDSPFTPRLRFSLPGKKGVGTRPEKSDPSRHGEMVRQVRMFLEGRDQALIRILEKKMKEDVKRLNFEGAGKIRDQIDFLKKIIEKQKIVSRELLDQDAFGFSRRGAAPAIYLLFIRRGKIMGGRRFSLPASDLPNEEILGSFLRGYYQEGEFIPGEILLPEETLDQTLLTHWLAERKKKKVRIRVPRRGERRRLVEMAGENAEKGTNSPGFPD